MAAYTYYTDTSYEGKVALIEALTGQNSGLVIDENSIVVHVGSGYYYEYGEYGEDTSIQRSLSYYDGSLDFGIGAGLLLTTGNASPNKSNTMSYYGTSLSFEDSIDTDADLSNIAKVAFSGSGDIEDATWLQFDFTVLDPYNTKGISFDLMFGSEEYPEYSNSSFVDIAGVFLNGTNVALFNDSSINPLSVIQSNIDLGFFRDNSLSTYPIEYDGISNKLTIYSPLQPGKNTLKIGIADTGDSSYDSGLFISNLVSTKIGGAGLSNVVYATDGNDIVDGTNNNETYELGAGDDIIYLAAGHDVVLAGTGNDIIYSSLDGDKEIDGGIGHDKVVYDMNVLDTYVRVLDNDTVKIGANSDTLLNIEEVAFNDITLNTRDLLIEDDIAKIYVAYFGRAADPLGLEYWLNDIKTYQNNGLSYANSLKNIITSFAKSPEAESMYSGMNSGSLTDEGITNFITNVYQNLFDRAPDADGLAWWLQDAQNLQSNGVAVGTLIKTIIDGAMDSQSSLDRTIIQNKAQVAWDYAKQFQLNDKQWSQSQVSEATEFINNISSDNTSVINAYDDIITLVGYSPVV